MSIAAMMMSALVSGVCVYIDAAIHCPPVTETAPHLCATYRCMCALIFQPCIVSSQCSVCTTACLLRVLLLMHQTCCCLMSIFTCAHAYYPMKCSQLSEGALAKTLHVVMNIAGSHSWQRGMHCSLRCQAL